MSFHFSMNEIRDQMNKPCLDDTNHALLEPHNEQYNELKQRPITDTQRLRYLAVNPFVCHLNLIKHSTHKQ